jgi:hypothetical protein
VFALFFLPCRADELETALMEMVKQDNRRQLSAKVIEYYTVVYKEDIQQRKYPESRLYGTTCYLHFSISQYRPTTVTRPDQAISVKNSK